MHVGRVGEVGVELAGVWLGVGGWAAGDDAGGEAGGVEADTDGEEIGAGEGVGRIGPGRGGEGERRVDERDVDGWRVVASVPDDAARRLLHAAATVGAEDEEDGFFHAVGAGEDVAVGCECHTGAEAPRLGGSAVGGEIDEGEGAVVAPARVGGVDAVEDDERSAEGVEVERFTVDAVALPGFE